MRIVRGLPVLTAFSESRTLHSFSLVPPLLRIDGAAVLATGNRIWLAGGRWPDGSPQGLGVLDAGALAILLPVFFRWTLTALLLRRVASVGYGAL